MPAVQLIQKTIRMAAAGAAGDGPTRLALSAPRMEIDALPYIDNQYNNPGMKAQVDALIAAEMRTFQPSADAVGLAHTPHFEATQLIQSEWTRVCNDQPMPKLDVARYALETPSGAQQNDPAAWKCAMQNAQAQLGHQANRLVNLELLAQHGAPLWRAHLNWLDAAVAQCAAAVAEEDAEIEVLNRKRKSEQLTAGLRLQQLEAQWVTTTKKNLEIESQCLRLEASCATLKEQLEAKEEEQRQAAKR